MREKTRYKNSTRGTSQTCVTTNVCRDKHVFVATKHVRKYHLCRDKITCFKLQKTCFVSRLVSRQMFVVTNTCSWRQNMYASIIFCRDKITCFKLQKTCFVATNTRVCPDKTFVATKMILVAASASDMFQPFSRPRGAEESCVGSVQKDLTEDLLADCWPFVLVGNTSCPVRKLISASA